MLVSDLIRYDPIKDCFVLKDFMTNPTWPDGTPKSVNNAFTWRKDTPSIAPPTRPLNARAKDLNSNGGIHTFSTAGKEKIPYGRTKKFIQLNNKI
jgi:hypothetical protein